MIARRLVRDDWWKVLAYTAILLVNLVFTVHAFPTFKANYTAILNLIPDFVTILRNAVVEAGEGRLPVFVALNHFFKGANVIGPAAAILLALGSVVREVEIGTIGLLLSRPISRTRILWTFIAVHVVELTVPLLLVSSLIPWLARTFIGEEVALGPMLLAAAHACAFVCAVYAITTLFAVLLSEQLRVAAAAGGVCVVSFILYFVEVTRPFTLYNLSSIHTYALLAQGQPYPWLSTGLCLGLAAACLATATLLFRIRDY